MTSHARWPGRLGQQGGVVKLEGPGQLGKQAGAVVKQDSLTTSEAGPAGKKFQLTFLVLKCFPRLSQSERIRPVCDTYLTFLWSILSMVYPLSFLVLKLGAGPLPPLLRQDGMGVDASLKVIRTQG